MKTTGDRRAWSTIAVATALACLFAALPASAFVLDGSPTPREPFRPPDSTRAVAAAAPSRVFRGIGAWVDMFDKGPWKYPERAVAKMAAHDVKTLYVETSNYRMKVDIFKQNRLARLIESAHASGIEVVTWYLPSFKNLKRDFRRARASINFVTPFGERADGFALDIEATVVRDIDARNRKAMALSRRIRNHVGAGYPLGAITPEAGASYWPHFNYQGVADLYDAFLPMTYYTYRTNGQAGVYRYTARNVAVPRSYGDPVHPIGGLAGHASRKELRGFVRAVRANGAVGASLYDFPLMKSRDWKALSRLDASL